MRAAPPAMGTSRGRCPLPPGASPGQGLSRHSTAPLRHRVRAGRSPAPTHWPAKQHSWRLHLLFRRHPTRWLLLGDGRTGTAQHQLPPLVVVVVPSWGRSLAALLPAAAMAARGRQLAASARLPGAPAPRQLALAGCCRHSMPTRSRSMGSSWACRCPHDHQLPRRRRQHRSCTRSSTHGTARASLYRRCSTGPPPLPHLQPSPIGLVSRQQWTLLPRRRLAWRMWALCLPPVWLRCQQGMPHMGWSLYSP